MEAGPNPIFSMNRRQFLTVTALTAMAEAGTPDLASALAAAAEEGPRADLGLEPPPLIPAPPDPAQWPAFREGLAAWRNRMRRRLNYDDSLYRRHDFAWVQSSFACCFVMLCDQTFHDRAGGRYTVDAFLDAGLHRHGGYDSIVLWHAYPRIGLDDRNQFDFYRDSPGGIPGLGRAVAACHARNVKVFLNYNPWDTGTRREGCSDLESLIELLRLLDADGIFLDTLNRGTAEFRSRLEAVRPGLVLESELALPLENVHDHHLSWAQWFGDREVPGVLRNKWFERRHMQHQIKRWNVDHSEELHTAWMNGSGMLVWENVFGTWLGWNPRDCSILRAMLPIQRRYAALFNGEGWTPLVPTANPGVHASLWEGDGLRLWTLVNRSDQAVTGTLLSAPALPGNRYFDLIAGREFTPPGFSGTSVPLNGGLAPRGVGAFLAGPPTSLGGDFAGFLQTQRETHQRRDWNTTFPGRPTLPVPVPSSVAPRHSKAPAGMAAIPAWRGAMITEFRVRECGFLGGDTDRGVVASRLHQPGRLRREVSLEAYAIDVTPVTNRDYAVFLNESGYRPVHPENFLGHWTDGTVPPGLEEHPVVWVDLEDARAYARWAGKRLPSGEEWQFAAQGSDGRIYPWGDSLAGDRCNAGENGGTTPVTRYPEGQSPFGCYDLCGNTWEWTETEHSDGRTRFCFIRGGSCFRAEGSDWYMDGGPRPAAFAAKMLLTWPGLDRCATVGFRCAVSLAG